MSDTLFNGKYKFKNKTSSKTGLTQVRCSFGNNYIFYLQKSQAAEHRFLAARHRFCAIYVSPVFARSAGHFAKSCSVLLHEGDGDAGMQPLHEPAGGLSYSCRRPFMSFSAFAFIYSRRSELCTPLNCLGHSRKIAYFLLFLYAYSSKKAKLLS